MTAIADTRARLEAIPRRALGWGGGMLILGLGAVGVGASGEGAVLALAGLFLTIFGIHSFGRLGPEDLDAPEGDWQAVVSRAEAVNALWTGGGVLVMGLAVTLGTHVLGGTGRFILAYGAILGGLGQMVRGYRQLQSAARPARSRVPAATQDEDEAPAPKRRKRKRRPPSDGA